MTTLFQGENSFFLGARASVIDESHEIASWASSHIQPNPALKWILGKFVEADRPNSNRQFWTFDGLQLGQPTIAHAPMNMLHRPRHIVGAFVGTEMMYPLADAADDANAHPYIESLGAFWRYYFPGEMVAIQQAHDEGSLFFSMECVADTVTCGGPDGCASEFAYDGPTSETYCDHLNNGPAFKQLNNPHFLGGALIIPPERPGWSGAEIKEISAYVAEHAKECEMAYKGISQEFSHLSPVEWEQKMLLLVDAARTQKS